MKLAEWMDSGRELLAHGTMTLASIQQPNCCRMARLSSDSIHQSVQNFLLLTAANTSTSDLTYIMLPAELSALTYFILANKPSAYDATFTKQHGFFTLTAHLQTLQSLPTPSQYRANRSRTTWVFRILFCHFLETRQCLSLSTVCMCPSHCSLRNMSTSGVNVPITLT